MATIDLAHRQSLRVGRAEIRPATCEIVGPNGREEIEPKVMQVLLALADVGERTVTRDDLTALCWDGRIVGNDAINRIILKIRKLAAGVGDGSFTVRTIPKIGYRLSVEDEASGPVPRHDPPGPAVPSRWPRRRIAATTLGGIALLVGMTALGVSGESVTPESFSPPAQVLAPAARDLAMRGAAAAFEQTAGQQAQAVRYFRAAVARAPDSSALWGSLAINYVLALPYTPPAGQGDILLRARQAAQRSLRINPREGHALAAATYLKPAFRNWPERERLHRLAIQRSDQGSPAPIIHYGRFLTGVGRTGDAIRQVEEAMRIHPLVPWLNVSWIELLQVNGRLDEAEEAADRASRLWPRNHDLWITRFFLLAFNGKTKAAKAMAEDETGWPEGVRPGDMALLRRAAEAIGSGRPAAADAVLADYARLAGEGQGYAEQGIRIAAALDRPDAAFRMADSLYGDAAPAVTKKFVDHDEYGRPGERDTAPLFLQPASRLWGHPRFLPLAVRIGLVDYWRRAGAPDLCRDPATREACRAHGLGSG